MSPWQTTSIPPRLKKIDVEGLAADVDALAGAEFLLEVRHAHKAYGEALGVTKPAEDPSAVELLAYWAPFARLEARWRALRDPSYPEVALCRSCGAALSLSADAVAVRRAYCATDNLVSAPKPSAFRRAHEVESVGRAQLDEAIATLRMLEQQRRLVRWLSLGMLVPLLGVLAFALRKSRAPPAPRFRVWMRS